LYCQISTEGNLENLDDDTDGSGQMGREKTVESSDTEDSIKERSLPDFEKVITVAKALNKKSE